MWAALLTAASSWPKVSTVASIRERTSSSILTSARRYSALPPSVRSSAASASPSSSWRPDTTTDAPSRPNAVAVARPIPVSAPVTNTTCSLMCVPSFVRQQLPLRFAALMTRRTELRISWTGLDFVDLVVFERHQVLDDKGKGVDSFPDGVDAGSLEDEIAPRPRGAPVCRFDDALGLELPHDPHLVVAVWCQRIWTGYGKFGNPDHVLFSYQVGTSVP